MKARIHAHEDFRAEMSTAPGLAWLRLISTGEYAEGAEVTIFINDNMVERCCNAAVAINGGDGDGIGDDLESAVRALKLIMQRVDLSLEADTTGELRNDLRHIAVYARQALALAKDDIT